MPNRDPEADNKTFAEIKYNETDCTLDPGIRIFGEMIQQTEDFINEEHGELSPKFDSALNGLNDEWKYYDDIATIGGRIYLADDAIQACVPEEWGQPCQDDYGEHYYFVDSVELRSKGIVQGYGGELNENDNPTEVGGFRKARFGFGLSLPDDHGDEHHFIAYPLDTHAHSYGEPTNESVDIRLHHDWTEIMMIVDKFILPNEKELSKIPNRLTALARKFQIELRQSENLRLWLGRYITERIGFDSKWSVSVTMQGPVLVIDDEQDTVLLDIKQPHSEHCFKPNVIFPYRNDGNLDTVASVQAALMIGVPQPADEDYEMSMMVPTTSITKLRSSRRGYSIVDVALSETYEMEDATDVVDIELLSSAERVTNEGQFFVHRLRQYDQALTSFIAGIRQVNRNLHLKDKEMVEDLCIEKCHALAEELKSITAHEIPLRLRGSEVFIPNISAGLFTNGLELRINTDQPIDNPDVASDLIGHFDSIYAGVQEVEEEDGTYYYLLPQLLVNIGSMPFGFVNQPANLVQGVINKRAAVHMDKFNAISIVPLEQIDDYRDKHGAFKTAYPKSRTLRLIDTLKQAEVKMARDSTKFTDMENISLLHDLASVMAQHSKESWDAIQLVESMLINAVAELTGTVYLKDGLSIENYSMRARFIGVVNHPPLNENIGPSFVMVKNDVQGSELYYVPIHEIRTFSY